VPTIDVSDLEEYWKDVRIRKVEFRPEAPGPEAIIDRASDAARGAILHLLTLQGQVVLDAERFTTILVDSMKLFAHALYEEQRRQDATFLIQLFLDGTGDLPSEDVKGFLQALPREVLERILARLEGTGHGLHALLSLELLWRDELLEQDYELKRDQDGKIVVTFYPKEVSEALSFRLRDLFENTT